ncbi:MAG: S24 family peptidase, partial [Lachnospiraceae bacterium]|nr:S24 family peptidase [Lachnospiraceae bacterium]
LMANYFNVSKSELVEAHTDSQQSKAVVIPVLGRVAAGIPLTAAEYIIDTEEIPQAMAADGEYFGLQVKGDSMEPKISNGDVVIVRKQSDADDGDLVIALVNGDDAVVKRLKKYKDGIALISSNPIYEPMFFSKSEIEEKPVEIIGKVKELRAKF